MNTKNILAFVLGVMLGALFVSHFIPDVIVYERVEVVHEEEVAVPQILATSTSRYTATEHIYAMASEYNLDVNLALEIMRCEGVAYAHAHNIAPSEAKHYNYDKAGLLWSVDVGRWQINDYFHQARATKLGLDIYDDFDNIEYGFILFSEKGTEPWEASRYCWDA